MDLKTDSPEYQAMQTAKVALGTAYVAVEARFPGMEPAYILAGFGECLATILAFADAEYRTTFLSRLGRSIEKHAASSDKTTSLNIKLPTRLM